jgi:tetratricopeptide (TPR) repeat protein
LLKPFLDGGEPPALVIVTSDHGEALGEHGEQTHGLFAYEPTLKVPLVVWGPGVTPGRDGRPARHIDIAPTILQALGLAVPAPLAGRSLLADPVAGETTYFEALSTNLNRGWAPLRGLLKDGKKWIDLPLPELYDLPADPGERANLFATERRTGAALRAALPAESVWPPPRGEISAEEEARLRSLGYFSGSAEAKAAYTAEDDPKNLIEVDRKLHQGIDLYSRGRYAEAAELAREVAAARPDMAEGYEHLALCLRQLERHDEAIEVLRGALARGIERPSLRRQLGLALSEAGRAAEAVTILSTLVAGKAGHAADAADNADTATLNAYGNALSEAGRHADALAVLQRSVAAAPEDPKGSENLGITLLRMDRPAEARDALRRALAINPALPISWNTLGVALYRLEGPAAALDAWEKAVAIDPSQYDALFNIGLVAAEAGRPAQARRALTRFVETAPRGRWGADVQKAQRLLAELGS